MAGFYSVVCCPALVAKRADRALVIAQTVCRLCPAYRRSNKPTGFRISHTRPRAGARETADVPYPAIGTRPRTQRLP
jgi:hypothetical protein